MYEPILLIIVALILAETSFLVVRRQPGLRGVPVRGAQRAILVDTSVLIDGRILDIASAGFIPGRLVIPRSVLGELQLLADGSDHEKRNRARNGLEVITKLQAIPQVSLEIYRDSDEAREGVDNRLLALARQLGYELCTVDYNLQKVAQAESITILSINELSQKLRALYLPGEKIELLLKQKGQEKGQAVGYASDGTMVVVDHADKLIDKTVSVEVIRSLQTNSGKMMFAKLANAPATGSSQPQQPSKPRGEGRLFNRRTPRAPQPSTQAPAEINPSQPRQNSQRPVNPRNRRPSRPQSPEDELLNLVNGQ